VRMVRIALVHVTAPDLWAEVLDSDMALPFVFAPEARVAPIAAEYAREWAEVHG